MTAKLDLPDIRQGETWEHTFVLTNETNEPIDLTGCLFLMQIRTKPGGAILFTLSQGDDQIVVDGPSGTIKLVLSNLITRDFLWKEGVYDLLMIDTIGRRKYLVEGVATVSRRVTEES